MVKEGSREENLSEIREIIDTKKKIGNNLYEIADKANNKLEIDIATGLIYRYKDNNRILCNTVDTSKKQNGYLYCPVTIRTKSGALREKEYSQHGLVAMLTKTDDFDKLIATNSKVVPNHKNNIPWDNRPKNLEWTTESMNTLHGKIVSSLWHNRFYVNNMTHRVWTGTVYNNSDKEFHALVLPISVDDLEAYQEHIGKGLRSFWRLKDNEFISERDIVAFVSWLDKNRINSERQVRNCNMSTVVKFDDNTKVNTNTAKSLTLEEEVEQFFKN